MKVRPDFKKAWENRKVKIVNYHGDIKDTITTDVLWKDSDTPELEIEYKGKRIPCKRIIHKEPPSTEYEAYI